MDKLINISFFWFETVLYSQDPTLYWNEVEYLLAKEGF